MASTSGSADRSAASGAGDEAALIAAICRGDTTRFEILVNRYERRIFRLAINIVQNDGDAEEVMQDAFLKAFEHLNDFKGDSSFYTWLTRITINQALMKLRKRRGIHISLDQPADSDECLFPPEVEDWGPTPEERYSQEELACILSEAIASLSPALRLVFQLRDVEEISTTETAEILGASLPAVKSRLLHARLQLRKKLDRYFRLRRKHPAANSQDAPATKQ